MSHTHDESAEPHLIPYKTYVLIWMALCTLTLVTVGVSYANLRHMTIIVALIIACGKSTLVVLWFMHVKFENRAIWWFLIATILTYVTFVLLTFADYSFR
jgi:cytochrome c oxidase subunit 4